MQRDIRLIFRPKAREQFDILRQHCDEVGRNYDDILRTAEIFVGFADNEAEAERITRRQRGKASLEEYRQNSLVGTAEYIAEGLHRIADAGAQYFVIYLMDSYKLEPVQRLAEQVISTFK